MYSVPRSLYNVLARDREFVGMLQSVWQIELSENMLGLYRMNVMFRYPFVRTDSGYHVPSSEEVIAGIRAYFNPAHLSGDALAVEDRSSRRLRNSVLVICRGLPAPLICLPDDSDVQGLLFQAIAFYVVILVRLQGRLRSDRAIPLEVSEAIGKVSYTRELRLLQSSSVKRCDMVFSFLAAWILIHTCLDNPNAGSACECPLVYFFVKCCFENGLGVPNRALALYDRMNMQLSREFIRCANPTCELNRLDQSTGQLKFKKCSRCKAVIYCSRECQVAHYPEHKRLCREHLTGREGS